MSRVDVAIAGAGYAGLALACLCADAGLRVGCTVEGLEREGGRVSGLRYTDAAGDVHTLEAALVVGADGVDSRVRRALDPEMRWRTGPDRYLIAVSPRPPAHEAAVLTAATTGATACIS